MTRRRIVTVWLAALPAVLCAQPPAEVDATPLVERLAGEWQGEGAVLGRPSRATLVFDRVLAGRFLRLRFRNEMGGGDDPPTIFEGHGYYRLADAGEALTGRWFDARGLELPLVARVEAEALVVDWGSAETERGRTTYRLRAPDELEVVDEVVTGDGELAEFGRVAYRRAATP